MVGWQSSLEDLSFPRQSERSIGSVGAEPARPGPDAVLSFAGDSVAEESVLTSPTRLVFITNIASPYQIEFFAALSRREGIALRVFFCSKGEHDRRFNRPDHFPFDATVLPSWRIPGTPKDAHIVSNLTKHLSATAPHDVAVLSGSYFMPALWGARRFVRRHRVPWYYWGEDPRKKGTSGIWPAAKEFYLRRFLHSSAGVCAVGSRAARSYRDLVADPHQVRDLPYAIDPSKLEHPSDEVMSASRRRRSEWGVEDPVVVLFAGSLTPRKAPGDLLSAFAGIAGGKPRWMLQFAGTGPLQPSLEEEVRRLGLSDRVRFLGHLAGDALHAAYHSSDLFVLPTRTHEGWGVVVHEALAAGLPVVVSDRVGAGDDLVQGRGTGLVYPAGDVAALTDRLSEMADDSGRRHFAERTRAVARENGADSAADRWADLAKTAAAAQRPIEYVVAEDASR